MQNKQLSINSQCKLLGLSKGSLYYKKKSRFNSEDLKILNRMDEIYSKTPIYGYRKIHQELKHDGFEIGKDRVLKYMQVLGIEAIYPRRFKTTSVKDKSHKVYPYLLNGMEISQPNQVWAIDITYIRLTGGFVYFVGIIDWYSRCLLSYQISNSLEIHFCLDVLKEALSLFPKPQIFNSDQGSQFTSEQFTNILKENEIAISMDSKGRALDNIIIERFFRTLKYEDIYLKEYQNVKELKQGINEYIDFYNNERFHQSLNYHTPKEMYKGLNTLKLQRESA
jgi:putative transposase